MLLLLQIFPSFIMGVLSYFITGANSGVGIEATRQLALHFHQKQSEQQVKIYLLCRSEEKARNAIAEIYKSMNDEGKSSTVQLDFMKFDAYDDPDTIRKNIKVDQETMTIGGILLNAGGFGDGRDKQKTKNKKNTSDDTDNSLEACSIAKLNIIGHVVLVHHLLRADNNDSSTRIIAAGSEASFATPGVTMDYASANFVSHLSGSAKVAMMGMDYGWTKGILALYWAAFARHHPHVFVRTVSPGAIAETQLLHQESVSSFMRTIARMTQWFGGSHSVQEGAKRYVDSLLLPPSSSSDGDASGSFWASRQGFVHDYGNVATIKNGKFVADEALQDKAWEAVNKFL